MTVIGEAFIAVRPDTQGFAANAEKGVLGSVTGIAKKAAAILGGAFVAQKGFDFLKDSVAAARESNAVAAQTAAAIKSTGGAANVTAKQIDELANSIARKTGIDDEEIGKAENLLLTFTNVRNEAGKGNDIFNQSTKILADMGKALGTDTSGAAIQLGKALNDPVAGISALTRVGVTFNDKQKETIKNLVATGKTAEAQKVILAELSKEFGGSAEAQATASQKLKVTLGNLQEDIGNKLIPVIDKVAGFLADRLPGALDTVGRAFGVVQRAVQPFIDALRGAFAGEIIPADQLTGIQRFVRSVVFGVQALVSAFKGGGITSDGFVGQMERLGVVLRTVYDKALKPFVAFVKDNLQPILVAAGIAFGLLAGPIVGPIALLATLAIRFKVVRDAIGLAVSGISAFVSLVADQVSTIVEAFSERFDKIREAAGHVIKALEVVIAVALAPIILIWQQFGDRILAVVGVAFEQLKADVEFAVRVVRDIIDVVLNLINGDWGAAWDALKDIPAAVLEFVVGSIGRIMEVLKQVIAGGVEAAVGFIGAIPGKLLGLVGGILSAAAKVGAAIIDGIGHGLSSAAGFAGDVAKSVVNAIINLINKQVIDRINEGIPDSLGAGPFKVSLPKNPVPRIPRLAAGALVTARPGGIIANIAEGGRDEGVLPLPKGVIEGLQRIANGGTGGQLFRDLVVQGATADGADRTASSLVRELRAEAFRQGK